MKITLMKIVHYVDDRVEFVSVYIISVIISIKVVLFYFILKLFISVIIFKVKNIVY